MRTIIIRGVPDHAALDIHEKVTACLEQWAKRDEPRIIEPGPDMEVVLL
jgi:hypothetical protein